MTFRNRYLFILFCLVCLTGLIFQLKQHASAPDEYDEPKRLSGPNLVLDLRHVKRTCDCPDWMESSRFGDLAGRNPQDYLYLEPATSDMEVPASYWAQEDSGYVLRVHGQYYQGTAIPYDYQQKTDQKPERARVFHYTSFEVVKPE